MKFLHLSLFLGATAALPSGITAEERSVLASRALATVASPNNVSVVNDNDGVGAGRSTYVAYKGNGTVAAGWPTRAQWASFNNMWSANSRNMLNSCGWNAFKSKNGTQAPNTSQNELTLMRNAVETIAARSKVDHRFILAVILQESEGCVRVPTSKNAVYNPGLMQSHQGSGNCNDNYNLNNDNYAMLSPCPQGNIQLMIQDGAQGTSSGAGLAGNMNSAAGQNVTGAAVYYWASRLYNSGSVCNQDLSNACGATASYASDVANRLMGWVPS